MKLTSKIRKILMNIFIKNLKFMRKNKQVYDRDGKQDEEDFSQAIDKMEKVITNAIAANNQQQQSQFYQHSCNINNNHMYIHCFNPQQFRI